MMLEQTGIPREEDLAEIAPPAQLREKGAVAWIECFQRIPCNPCVDACPVDAIQPFSDINDRPTIDHEACIGCGQCVAACPGLAIFVVDESDSHDGDLVGLPYEFAPRPEVDQRVTLLNRAGEECGEGRVHLVHDPPAYDRTAVVWVEVPRGLGSRVRAIRPPFQMEEADEG